MKVVSALIKMQLMSLFSSLFNRSGSGKKRGAGFKVLVALLAVYVVAVMLFMVGFMFVGLLPAFAALGVVWLYWGIVALLAVGMSFVFTVFVADSQLFSAKDNELLMSMPIRPRHILMTRMLSLYLVEVMFTLLVIIPAAAVYFIFFPFSALTLTGCIFAAALLPLLALALATAAGWLIGFISSRIRRKNLITALLMAVMFIGFMAVYMNMYAYVNQLAANAGNIAEAFQNILPAYHFGLAMTTGNPLYCLLTLIWCVLPAAAVYFVLSRNFIKIATTNRGSVRTKYVEKPMKVSGVRGALLKKEFQMFTSMPYYMFNNSIGLALLLVYSGGILLKGRDILAAVLTEFTGMGISSGAIEPLVAPIAATIICFCVIMNIPSCSALSLEGSNVWILRSCPIPFKDVVFAKAGLTFVLGLPFIALAAAVTAMVFPVSAPQVIALFLLPLSLQLFAAVWGFTVNVWLPRFNWVSATQIVKNSASAILGVLGAMVFAAVPVVVFAFFGALFNFTAFLYFAALFFLFLTGLLCLYLFTGGKKAYENINA